MGRKQQHNVIDKNQRMERLLRGAFSGPPTPLKDIPKKSGESRQQKRKKTSAAKKS
jgi:hypothetical protein